MAKKTYYEKLKDPRWQKKRLEILERDNFKCSQCRDGENTLNVHHGYYTTNYNPWDYPNETLHTVCEMCHEEFECVKHDIHRALGSYSIKELTEAFQELHSKKQGTKEVNDSTPIVEKSKTVSEAIGTMRDNLKKANIDKLIKYPSLKDLKKLNKDISSDFILPSQKDLIGKRIAQIIDMCLQINEKGRYRVFLNSSGMSKIINISVFEIKTWIIPFEGKIYLNSNESTQQSDNIIEALKTYN